MYKGGRNCVTLNEAPELEGLYSMSGINIPGRQLLLSEHCSCPILRGLVMILSLVSKAQPGFACGLFSWVNSHVSLKPLLGPCTICPVKQPHSLSLISSSSVRERVGHGCMEEVWRGMALPLCFGGADRSNMRTGLSWAISGLHHGYRHE